ncbi:MAG: flagellar export chaperone FlgN [Phycisphaerales bacterium]|nr:flagellar export chaperone FlgN [Phycisphaerales bacterium]
MKANEASDIVLASELEDLLRELIVCYEQLYSLTKLTMGAMRDADTGKLSTCVGQQNQLVQRVAEAEKRRIRVVGSLAERYGSPARTQTTVTWLAERLGGEAGQRLRVLSRALKTLLERVHSANASTHAAADMLARHMEGIVRRIAGELRHAGLYGRQGAVAGGAVRSALNIRH